MRVGSLDVAKCGDGVLERHVFNGNVRFNVTCRGMVARPMPGHIFWGVLRERTKAGWVVMVRDDEESVNKQTLVHGGGAAKAKAKAAKAKSKAAKKGKAVEEEEAVPAEAVPAEAVPAEAVPAKEPLVPLAPVVIMANLPNDILDPQAKPLSPQVLPGWRVKFKVLRSVFCKKDYASVIGAMMDFAPPGDGSVEASNSRPGALPEEDLSSDEEGPAGVAPRRWGDVDEAGDEEEPPPALESEASAASSSAPGSSTDSDDDSEAFDDAAPAVEEEDDDLDGDREEDD